MMGFKAPFFIAKTLSTLEILLHYQDLQVVLRKRLSAVCFLEIHLCFQDSAAIHHLQSSYQQENPMKKEFKRENKNRRNCLSMKLKSIDRKRNIVAQDSFVICCCKRKQRKASVGLLCCCYWSRLVGYDDGYILSEIESLVCRCCCCYLLLSCVY